MKLVKVYSQSKIKPVHYLKQKWLPTFIKNFIIDAYEISQSDKHDVDLALHLYLTNLLYFIILFLFNIIVILLNNQNLIIYLFLRQ